jgi:hypothetical protein
MALMTLIDIAISELIQGIKESGGSTVSLIGLPVPDSGFMVGGYTDSLIFDKDLLSHGTVANLMVTQFVSGQSAFATRFDIFLGGWIDTQTDLVYIDLSKHFDSLGDALIVAALNEEIAIWNLGKAEEVCV